ncbi:NrsF family protein [Brevundimonas variabilis]|uniref:DUF1109 domain-containing protein n=1 Tax=Brevundimonas variabilis TaxID=74312 RepID=A0A7W9CHW4_9CAUL|nr:DUF1109 domain-containing protein [Brevundimonas variabilis]MBB5745950.1 hypothetical protein [Brevundimonas variabilis]
MKTDDLIQALAVDLPARGKGRIERRLLLTLIPAGLLVLAGVGLWLGFRSDLSDAMLGPTFWAKAAFTTGLAASGFWLLARLGRPGASALAPLLVLAALLLGVAGLAIHELTSMPMPERMPALMGDSARACAPNILLLSALAAPFVFWSAKAFAPTRPTLAGAAAGLLTAGVATTLYGLHCPEYTASFVAVWYMIGISLAVAAGAAIGRLVFRW